MEIILSLIALAIVGLLVGALGRLGLPGKDPMTLMQTMLLGIAAILIASIIAVALFGADGAGILLSVLVAVGIVFAVRKFRERGTRTPATDAGTRRGF